MITIIVLVSVSVVILAAGLFIIYRALVSFKDIILRDAEFTRGKLVNYISKTFKRSDIDVPEIEVASDELIFRREIEKIKSK